MYIIVYIYIYYTYFVAEYSKFLLAVWVWPLVPHKLFFMFDHHKNHACIENQTIPTTKHLHDWSRYLYDPIQPLCIWTIIHVYGYIHTNPIICLLRNYHFLNHIVWLFYQNWSAHTHTRTHTHMSAPPCLYVESPYVSPVHPHCWCLNPALVNPMFDTSKTVKIPWKIFKLYIEKFKGIYRLYLIIPDAT